MSGLLVLVVAGFIVMAGGASVAMQQLEIGPFSPEPKLEEPVESAKPALDPVRFVVMAAMNIPIIRDGRVISTIQMEMQLETTQSRQRKLTQLIPKLTSAFLIDLYSYLPRLYVDRGDVDSEFLKKRLVVIGNREIGPGVFDAVLIQSILERRT